MNYDYLDILFVNLYLLKPFIRIKFVLHRKYHKLNILLLLQNISKSGIKYLIQFNL